MKNGRTRGDCVDSVILMPKIHYERSTLVRIFAKDKSSGQVLESQAKVGVVTKIEIQINYRHLYVNDKERLDIVGYDNEGNIFSGLDGFRFDWSIERGDSHLKFIQKPDGYKKKRVNDSTDVAYVKGLSPGKTTVKVRVFEPGYEQIAAVSKDILVIDPFIIEPQREVYILPTTAFNYNLVKLQKLDNGEMRRHPIKLPSKQYEWSTSNPQLGLINQEGKFIADKQEGASLIQVVDNDMTQNTDEVQIKVVLPFRLGISIYDVTEQEDQAVKADNMAQDFGILLDTASESKILVEQHLYLIVLQLYDKDGNRIEMTENLEFDNSGLLDQECIEKVKVNKIGSQILFRTKKI